MVSYALCAFIWLLFLWFVCSMSGKWGAFSYVAISAIVVSEFSLFGTFYFIAASAASCGLIVVWIIFKIAGPVIFDVLENG